MNHTTQTHYIFISVVLNWWVTCLFSWVFRQQGKNYFFLNNSTMSMHRFYINIIRL